MLSVKELAKKNYPTYWDINRLVSLVEAGKLTKASLSVKITNVNAVQNTQL